MKTLTAFLVVLLVAAAPAQVAKKPSLESRIKAVLDEKDARRAHWGIAVLSLDSGKVLYAHNEDQLFTPASNTKLFTTAAALETLGPNFKFRTTVETQTPPDKLGRIAGDIVLVGRGDPNLSSRVLPYRGRTDRAGSPLKALDLLADQVSEAHVNYVDGDVVADDSYFVYERYGDGWAQDDLVWAYGAPVSALTVNDNVIFVEILPGAKAGDPALLKFDPFEGYYRVENRIQTFDRRGARPSAGGGDDEGPARRILINREPGSHTLEFWGRIPLDDAGLHEQIAIEDPAMFAAQYFHAALQRRGVKVYGQPRARHLRPIDLPAAPRAATTILATTESSPLLDDLKVINKVSQNLHAEIMLRTLGREKHSPENKSEPGTVAAGLAELKAFLTQAGVAPEEYVFLDGSGLSRQNLVSPMAVVKLLAYMRASQKYEAWVDLLPVAGFDGSLSERLKAAAVAGKIRAKTGTLGHVNAISGYIPGSNLAFSIFVNNHNLRSREITQLVDRIAEALVN